jgi:hypothetical protein
VRRWHFALARPTGPFRAGMLGGMEGVQHVPSVYRTLRKEPPRDVAIARLAARQLGVVSLTQLKSTTLARTLLDLIDG